MNDHIPTITCAEDFDSGLWILFATSHGKTEPCGSRLFRAAPFPDIEFEHQDERQARLDCATLQAYIDRTWVKNVSKAKLRAQRE